MASLSLPPFANSCGFSDRISTRAPRPSSASRSASSSASSSFSASLSGSASASSAAARQVALMQNGSAIPTKRMRAIVIAKYQMLRGRRQQRDAAWGLMHQAQGMHRASRPSFKKSRSLGNESDLARKSGWNGTGSIACGSAEGGRLLCRCCKASNEKSQLIGFLEEEKAKRTVCCCCSEESQGKPAAKLDQGVEDGIASREQTLSPGVKLAIVFLQFYKREISPFIPGSCRYVPSCSQYSMEAFKKYGVVKGAILTAWRLARCNPLGGTGFDPPRWFGEPRPPRY